jgi:outer membrane protein
MVEINDMYRKSQKSKNTKKLAKRVLTTSLASAFIALAGYTTAFASEAMQLEKTLNSQTLIDAQALILKGDFNATYELLEPLEVGRAGEKEYDYLLGVAAVESNHLTRGAFALERVLARDPNHKDARAEMAKAYFLLGETEASKTEFNNVLQQNPDEKTKKIIEKLLTDIQKTEGTATTFTAYLDLGLGWDSNVSSVPNISAIAVPLIGGTFQLGNSALAKSDNFANLAAGISFRHPFTKQFSVFGGVNGTNHLNGSETAFDNSSLDFNAGLQYVQDKNNLIFSLQDSHFDLDAEGFRHAYGGSAQWIYNLDAYNQGGIYTQFTRLNYTGNSTQNSDRTIVGINAAHAFQGSYKPVMFASYYGGRDVARDEDVNAISQDVLGLRLGGQLNFNDQWQLFSTFSYELRQNDRKNTAFLKARKDDQYDATMGMRYTPARGWTVKPQISYTQNDSNIELYGYDRSIVSVNVRKDFGW